MTGNTNSGRTLIVITRLIWGLLCLCGAVALSGHDATEAAQGSFPGKSRFTPRFAIADFDGDLKPDLATVQVEQDAARGTHYSIRLQLSAGEESAIAITGPLGGLQLEPRDVNGDDALDLIVTTAMASRFVAILINDGHGKFRLARDGEFPGIEKDQGVRLGVAQIPAEEHATLQLPRSTFGIEELTESGAVPERNSRFLLVGPYPEKLVGFRQGKSARSPPAIVYNS